MGISLPVTLAVLAAAALHAGWNALLKASRDKGLENAALAASRGVVAVALLPWVAAPARPSWPWLAASVTVHVAYFWALAGAYRWGDLSLTYPVMRGGAPVLVALAATTAFGETLSPPQVAAVALICAGILGFATAQRGKPPALTRSLLFALGNAAVIATYTIIDARGVRASGAALGYALWFFAANGLVQIGLDARSRGREIPGYLARHWMRAGAGGAMTIASYATALWAMTLAPVALVAALRETSVIFGAAIGALFLGERVSGRRLVATGAVLAGLVALRF